jgi:flavin-dependent dehydrogenase
MYPLENYDVIIVGGGPAGLQCARILGQSDLRVLLLEKQDRFGDKLCAGGLYQRSLLEDTRVVVKTNSQVTEVGPDRVILKNGQAYGYRFLVGADGYASMVRRLLGLKVNKKLIGFQYTIPVEAVDPKLEIFLDAQKFSVWYAWIFPHRDSMAVGCCCDPERADHRKVKAGFLEWLKERNIDPGDARLESYPIAFDYQGVKFGNVFLAGEAAGLASGFTGEGVYQSLASGQEVAAMILDPAHEPHLLNEVIKYNRTLEKVMNTFRYAGPLKGFLQEVLVFLMTRRRIRDRINAGFS